MASSLADAVDEDDALSAVQRVAEAMRALGENEKSSSSSSPPRLSHWRRIPSVVEDGYRALENGAAFVRASATRHALVVGRDAREGRKTAADLVRGVATLAAGATALHDDDVGLGRAARRHARGPARAVVGATAALLSGDDEEAERVRRTGAAWSACDAVTEGLPKGNRTAVRRDLLGWTRDCDETTTEFRAALDAGPAEAHDDDHDDDDDWNAFCAGGDDRYAPREAEVAEASLALVKCSRGVIVCVLKACDTVGATENAVSLRWISRVYDAVEAVGEGVTELGATLYPPLNGEGVERALDEQTRALLVVLDTLLGRPESRSPTTTTTTTTDSSAAASTADDEDAEIRALLSEEVTELAEKIRKAVSVRLAEAKEALLKI